MSPQISALTNRPVIIGGGIAGLMTALATGAGAGGAAVEGAARRGSVEPVGAGRACRQRWAATMTLPCIWPTRWPPATGFAMKPSRAGSSHAAPAAVEHLARLGVAFDRRADGGWRLGLEAAHGRNRIVHATGDGTGREIMRALIAAVRRCPSITLLEGVEARRLIVEDNAIKGVLAVNAHGPLVIDTGRVVIATGGIGGLFLDSTNPAGCFGQGLALAARAGADSPISSSSSSTRPLSTDRRVRCRWSARPCAATVRS